MPRVRPRTSWAPSEVLSHTPSWSARSRSVKRRASAMISARAISTTDRVLEKGALNAATPWCAAAARSIWFVPMQYAPMASSSGALATTRSVTWVLDLMPRSWIPSRAPMSSSSSRAPACVVTSIPCAVSRSWATGCRFSSKRARSTPLWCTSRPVDPNRYRRSDVSGRERLEVPLGETRGELFVVDDPQLSRGPGHRNVEIPRRLAKDLCRLDEDDDVELETLDLPRARDAQGCLSRASVAQGEVGEARARVAEHGLGHDDGHPAGLAVVDRRESRDSLAPRGREQVVGPRDEHGIGNVARGREGARGQTGSPGHAHRRVGDRRGRAVAHGELLDAPRRREDRIEPFGPRARAAGRRRLREVADDRQGARRHAAQHGAPVHRGELLRLVDDDVAVGPRAVRRGALGRRERGAACREALSELLGRDEGAGGGGLEDAARVLDVLGVALCVLLGSCPRRLVVLTEKLGRLVDEGDVGGGPWRTFRPSKRLALVGAQLGGGRFEPVRLGEEVLDEPFGGERHPREVERDAHLARGAQVFHDVAALVGRDGKGELLGVLRGESREHLTHEGGSGLVVRAVAASRATDRCAHVRGRDDDRPAVDRDLLRCGGHALALAYRALDDPRPHGATLDLDEPRSLGAARVHTGHEVRDRRREHAGLTERRKHLVDVVQEVVARPHDEHARALEGRAVGVEQVGGTVQRHRRLARAWPALDDECSGERRAHDDVLLGLDRRDDVVHLAGAPRGERGEERALSREVREVRVLVETVEVKHLVLDPRHGATARDEVTATGDPVWSCRGRSVE